jgi:hypothetical protein
MDTPVIPDPLWYDDLSRSDAEPLRWVWYGYLAAGAVTLLTSRWKAGKTTLLSILLARMGAGGALAGSAVAAGRAVVVSEESPDLWRRRGAKLGFGPHLGFLCRPFRGKPTTGQWQALIDRLGAEHARRGLALAVIDPLANVLPGPDENSAAAMLAALAPLQRLTAAGVGVLLLHHPRKAAGPDGPAPRGSGALPGFADVLIELDGPARGAADDRRRTLRAVSRFEETPPLRRIELTADGTDYAVAADTGAEEFAGGWAVLRTVLEDTRHKLTRREVLAAWPQDHPKPDAATLWKWLERAVAAGLVARDGAGRKAAPYRYWLPGREAELYGDGLVSLPELPPLEQRAWLTLARAAVLRRRE